MDPELHNQECGIRHLFQVRHRDRVPNRYPQLTEELLHWCDLFDREGLAPRVGGASAGNLSFRTPGGFIITPSRRQLSADMSWSDFNEVVRSDSRDFTVHVLGPSVPSSDSFLHDRIYARRLDAQAVFHGHDHLVLKHAERLARELPIKVTAEARLFGTIEDAEETARELGSCDYIIRLAHGFVSVGRTLDAAGELALMVHRRAVELESID
jgi:ribulose-5-phosphate 4-epimerase/fuculose-1-phosphate aldolase